MTTIRSFNSGRLYSREGQRIAYSETIVDDMLSEVVFCDVDRGITGVFTLVRPVTHERVLSAYDHGGYGYCSDYALRDRLTAAAKAVEPLKS